MKNFLPLFLLFSFAIFVSSCSKEEEILIEPPAPETPTTTDEQGSFELTYDPSNVSTEQEFFGEEEGGVTDTEEGNENEVLDAPTMDTSFDIDVDRTPLGVINTSTTTEEETTTIKTFTRSE